MRAALGVLADVCCVLIFVAIGRANHHAGDTLAGVVSTSWPFLAGLAAGQGTALAFIIVSLIFLGLFLLGWRILAQRISVS